MTGAHPVAQTRLLILRTLTTPVPRCRSTLRAGSRQRYDSPPLRLEHVPPPPCAHRSGAPSMELQVAPVAAQQRSRQTAASGPARTPRRAQRRAVQGLPAGWS